MSKLYKVVSGGQTGADTGGLLAALAVGLVTDGWAPKGYKTENGSQLLLRDVFGLREHTSSNYRYRTFANVAMADATIRLAHTFLSPGEVCTKNAIKEYSKLYLDIDIHNPLPIDTVVKWLHDNNFAVLNVAGNKESTYPGIQDFTEQYLTEVFTVYGIDHATIRAAVESDSTGGRT